MERIEYGGWQNCWRLANDHLELVATADVGPRIIHLALRGGENVFAVFEEQLGETGGDAWRVYGGHRLWHAPEEYPRTMAPDNSPVAAQVEGGALTLTQPTELSTGIQKAITLRLAPDAPAVTVTHRLTNHNLWAVTFAPWALSVMAAGGTAIVPLPPRGPHDDDHLQPTASVATWAYTDMADPRWTWSTRWVMLRQQPGARADQKAGFGGGPGWAAYVRGGVLFAKLFDPDPGAAYPDRGSQVELFTNEAMLEVETLGPLQTVTPGGTVEHVERWRLAGDVETPRDEAGVERWVMPHVERWRA